MMKAQQSYGSVKELKNLDVRHWSYYDKPFKFNITVQTMDEINNYKGAKNNVGKDRYAF